MKQYYVLFLLIPTASLISQRQKTTSIQQYYMASNSIYNYNHRYLLNSPYQLKSYSFIFNSIDLFQKEPLENYDIAYNEKEQTETARYKQSYLDCINGIQCGNHKKENKINEAYYCFNHNIGGQLVERNVVKLE